MLKKVSISEEVRETSEDVTREGVMCEGCGIWGVLRMVSILEGVREVVEV